METEKINERRQWLFVFLVGLFVTNAVTAELISNKLIQIPFSFNFCKILVLFAASIW
jgi:hypothetical protein